VSAITTTAGVGTDVPPFTVTDASGQVWELVVGLEVHCELATATKIFCGCATPSAPSRTPTSAPCASGLPARSRAQPAGGRAGHAHRRALHCTVEPSIFARKNYFYPDMPKDYQVSQYDKPINVDGWLELPDGSVIGVERAHLEEDTGKSTHVGGGGRIHDALHSLVDYNRAGVPLVEIVGRPHIRTPEQARAYVQELRAVLLATGASDAKMEEGSMRVDANVSVRPAGSDQLGTRCEIKNLNSTRSLVRAIEYEARRQVDLLAAGERIVQQTRHWDEADGRTHTLAVQGGGGRLPLLPRARPRPARARRRVGGRRRRRPARAAAERRRRWGRAHRRRPGRRLPRRSCATSTASCSPPRAGGDAGRLVTGGRQPTSS
jgi:aspartyl-tRNA(Asn)/glutamyl-tRNA(Gln) amidotransferase subunit B